ncbi:Os01g0723025 [Oryza sativa Japonica Group]|uniref:Os01g0723025 protein n=1 Tax=Oryza sativa subsp. japonica TaxID=39947 RepID=A0A0P0V7L2_ORYSJ|nr:hypothetical protein EE612_005426 [Oryza sativa]BAS74101.1 Os01g0723025 [Oryza sativa Japonica Group]
MIGGPTMISAPPMKSSWRSLMQISRWSCPTPAMTCSPDSSMVHTTRGSDLARRFNPSTSLGSSEAFLQATDLRTTGDTENFMALMGCASTAFSSVSVAFLVMNWSRPTMATVLPQGTSSTDSCFLPIQITVRCTVLTYRSFFSPGTKLGPMIRTLLPVATVPEKTRPKAKNLPLSLAGIILDTYTMRGPLGSQLRMAVA